MGDRYPISDRYPIRGGDRTPVGGNRYPDAGTLDRYPINGRYPVIHGVRYPSTPNRYPIDVTDRYPNMIDRYPFPDDALDRYPSGLGGSRTPVDRYPVSERYPDKDPYANR